MSNADVTKEYGNPFGVPLIFFAPKIHSVGIVVDPDTAKQSTDVGFTVEGPHGPLDGNIFVCRSHPDILGSIINAQRNRYPILISGHMMEERHPRTGRQWLKGAITVLGDNPGTHHMNTVA